LSIDTSIHADDLIDELVTDRCVVCSKVEGSDDHWMRAGGDAICNLCGREYCLHPLDTAHRGYDGSPIFHKLCNGRLVKT
jgi:hypothetical protein